MAIIIAGRREDWPSTRIAPRVGTASVAPDCFDALDTRVLAGRGFDSGDADSDQGVVIVNLSFVDRVLGGRNAVGRRVRYAPPPGRDADAETEPWHRIVMPMLKPVFIQVELLAVVFSVAVETLLF